MAASASSSAIAGGGSRRRPSQGSIVRSARSGHSGTTQVTPVSKSSGPVPLARRLLFPTWPADQPLPLLLGTDADDPLDEELYDFIALALRAFVHSWWSKLSRFDRDFLPRITTILRDVFRTLSSRAQATDLSALLCVDAPALLSQHVRDYRAAAAAQGTAYAAGGATPFAHLFHQRQAHMALGSDGTISEEYVRCAVDHILRVCLPPEDYTPETERFIVREIVIMIVVRSVVPKVTQPWFIHKIMLDQLGAAPSDEHAGVVSQQAKKPFSSQTLVIFFLSAVQFISGFCLMLINTYKSIRETVRVVNESHAANGPTVSPSTSTESDGNLKTRKPSADEKVFTPPGSRASSTPPLFRSLTSYTSIHTTSTSGDVALPSHPLAVAGSLPDYTRASLDFMAELLTLRQRFGSSVLLAALTGGFAAVQPFLSKFIPYILGKNVGKPLVTNIVKAAKKALFPDGWPGPAPPDPSPEEQVAMRKALAQRLSDRVPASAAKLVLGPNPSRTIDAALSPFDDQACNIHLVLVFLDLVLLALFPELGVGGDSHDKRS